MSGGFVGRWSRRKADKAQAAGAPDAEAPLETPEADAAPPAPDARPAPHAPPVLSDEELAALPRIEDLTPESSLAPFLRAGVPAGLKNAAMRKMWLLTPAIRDHKDCAVDYHWDWNTPGGVPGSSGRMDPGAVQKMLRGLTDPRPPAPLPQEIAEPSPETNAEGEETPGMDAESPSFPSRPAADAEHAVDATPTDTPPRRRHGGARPA